MRNKQEKLEALVWSQRQDITGISDTWWDESCVWSALLDGYRFFRRDRQSRRGRKLALYVIDWVECMKLQVGNGTVESAWIRMKAQIIQMSSWDSSLDLMARTLILTNYSLRNQGML